MSLLDKIAPQNKSTEKIINENISAEILYARTPAIMIFDTIEKEKIDKFLDEYCPNFELERIHFSQDLSRIAILYYRKKSVAESHEKWNEIKKEIIENQNNNQPTLFNQE
jgi:hypothetical protein